MHDTENKNDPDQLIPVGEWIRVEPSTEIAVIGYTYLDHQAGFSAAGFAIKNRELDRSMHVIARLTPGIRWRLATAEETDGLKNPPDWLPRYGEQPPKGMLWGIWRTHAHLYGRFHADCPDDLQVMVHDGGPRLSPRLPEVVWVRVTGVEGDVFFGIVLNQPNQLETVKLHDWIKFIRPQGSDYLMLVTDKYLQERSSWRILKPCSNCGLTELFDAPSDMLRVVYPNEDFAARARDGAVGFVTTVICRCGGVQMIMIGNATDLDTGIP